MGACYSVTVTVSFKNEQEAVNILKEYMIKNQIGESLWGWYEEHGILLDSFDNLMKVFLAENQNKVDISMEGKVKIYSNDFEATYSWEMVLMNMFELITPYLQDGSKMLIYPDQDYDKLVVKNGKCIQTH